VACSHSFENACSAVAYTCPFETAGSAVVCTRTFENAGSAAGCAHSFGDADARAPSAVQGAVYAVGEDEDQSDQDGAASTIDPHARRVALRSHEDGLAAARVRSQWRAIAARIVHSPTLVDVGGYQSGVGRYASGRGGGRGGKGAWGTCTPDVARAMRSLTARTPGQFSSPVAPSDAAYVPYDAGIDLAWGLPPHVSPHDRGAYARLPAPDDGNVGASNHNQDGRSAARWVQGLAASDARPQPRSEAPHSAGSRARAP
jgi:hypothetical protein